MAYEALYRRYRPSTFADVAGQTHVVSALRNAVEGDRVGHAYLFSGPRGTGKTTSARILAKALNCTNLQGGEPCDECDSCEAFKSGGSYDLHELDAASNNGVDAMRDLIGKVALGSPGRTKVYILDEVHMLSSGAENALLKTLEEPPPHVVFVLATTEPNKVVPTIRSRTQHLEFGLLSAAEIGGLVDYVASDAGLEITPEDRSYVIRAGGGSARDTLSALDQVVAAGGAPQGGEHLDALLQALIDRDGVAALAAIDGAMAAGRDAASVATALLHELRTVFLATMRADVSHLPEAEQERAKARAAAMPPARVTRAVEVIGTSVIEMRQAPDPRVDLEVAVMRLTRTDLDTNPAALLERLEAVERQLSGGAPISATPSPAVADAPMPAQPAPAAPAQTPAHDSAHAPAPQQEHAPEQAPPAYDAPPDHGATAPAAAAPSAGRRGADMVRAELARQGISTGPAAAPQAEDASPQSTAPTAQAPPPSDPPAAVPAAEAVDPTPAAAPAASTGKTLADVRRERQAAAQATGATTDDPAVEAAAAARRERQAAALADGQASTAAPAPVQPDAQAEAPVVEPAPAPAMPQAEAPPAQVEAPSAAMSEPAPSEPATAPAVAPQSQQPPAAAPVDATPAEQPAPVQAEVSPPSTTPSSAGGAIPTLDELKALWPALLDTMSGRVRSRFSAGHFIESTADSVMFGLPNPVHRDRCEEIRAEVDDAFTNHFGRPMPLTLVVDLVEEEPDFFAAPPSGGAGAVEEADDSSYEEETVDVHDLIDATGDVPSAEDRIMTTFEGSTLLEDPSTQPHDR